MKNGEGAGTAPSALIVSITPDAGARGLRIVSLDRTAAEAWPQTLT